MIRLAAAQDLEALAALEAQAFGDDAAFWRRAFARFAGKEGVWLVQEEGEPLAAALTVPVTLGGQPGAYLYGLATRADMRGRGLMSALLEHLAAQGRQRGWQFLCLIPASPSLFDFYVARGFVTAFWRQEHTVPIRRNLLATAEFDDVTVGMLPQLRARFCRVPAVQLAGEGLVEVLTDYYTCGGCSVRLPGAYGFFKVRQGQVRFDEFFAADDLSAAALLQACREKTGCETARVLTGDGLLTTYCGSGRRLPYGMWRWLGPTPPLREAYMGLMMEE